MKKITKIKNKLVALLVLLPALAKAYVVYVVGISILIVGGIMLYKLIWLTKQVFPDPPPGTPPATNSVSGSYQIHEYWADHTWRRDSFGALTPFTDNTRSNMWALNDPSAKVQLQPTGGGLLLQYGVDHPSVPWIALADSPVSPNMANIQMSPDGTISISMLGTTLTLTTDSQDGDGYATNFTTYTNATSVITNSYGDVFTESTDTNVSVVIERTSDFISWAPIFTNTIPVGAIQTYTDYTPFPDPVTFTNGGTGSTIGPLPGGSVGPGTGLNVTTYTPGWYYRLHLLPNLAPQ